MPFFQDIFRSNFLNNIGTVTGFDMTVAVVLSFGMGIFILLIHRRIYYGAMYSESFGVSLVALCMITTVLILAVSSNVVLSLGMVGALSIVRFRAAVKEPMELAFIFWSMEAGLVLAAGVIPLAIGVNVAIGALLLLWVKRKSGDTVYMLVLRCEQDKLYEADGALTYVRNSVKRYQVKSRLPDAGTQETDGKSAGFPAEEAIPIQYETQPDENPEITELNIDSRTALMQWDSHETEKKSDIVELDIEVTLLPSKRKHTKGKAYVEVDDVTAFVDKLAKMPGVQKAALVSYDGAYTGKEERYEWKK